MAITVLTQPTDKRLITAAEVTAFTGYTSDSLDGLVTVVSGMVERRIGRPIFYGQYRETLPGSGDAILQLGVIPVSTEEDITVSDEYQEGNLDGVRLEEPQYGWLFREAGWLSSEPRVRWLTDAYASSSAKRRLYTVTYWAGWKFVAGNAAQTTVPVDLQYAAALSVKAMGQAGQRDLSVTSWSSADVSMTYRSANESQSEIKSWSGPGAGLLPQEALHIIDQYADAFR